MESEEKMASKKKTGTRARRSVKERRRKSKAERKKAKFSRNPHVNFDKPDRRLMSELAGKFCDQSFGEARENVRTEYLRRRTRSAPPSDEAIEKHLKKAGCSPSSSESRKDSKGLFASSRAR
jgi:hypothetical protein